MMLIYILKFGVWDFIYTGLKVVNDKYQNIKKQI